MKLSECGQLYKIADDYCLEICSGDHLILIAGADYGTASANFKHRSIIAKQSRVFELKHYRQGGSKFWTRRAGIDFYFAVPKDRIELIEEKGYSYVKVEIGGQRYSLSVSGGTSKYGWCDWIGQNIHTGIKHTINSILNLADNAISSDEVKRLGIEVNPKPLEYEREETFQELAAYVDVRKVISEGDVVCIAGGWTYSGVRIDFLKVKSKPRRKQYFHCEDERGRNVIIRYKAIDWLKTAKRKGLPLVSV